MQTLAEKLVSLERNVAVASRALEFWRKQIDTHGERKATEFYTHIGLNHIETKGVEWEGMTLRRQPTEAEKLCLKSVAQAQDAGKEAVGKVLLTHRSALITAGLKTVKKLKPAEYHSLVLKAPSASDLTSELGRIFIVGRDLVDKELRSQKRALPRRLTSGDEDELDDIAEVTISRVVNDVQAKIAEAVARYRLLGLRGDKLWEAVNDEMERGSVAYIDRLARGASSTVLNFGRFREADDRKDEWSTVEYSAILDQNVCGPCSAADGESAERESELTPAPNPACEGGDFCRCFHIFVFDTVA